jgi:predicted DCC family thiol-disulfide oxidoreductase YuxK
MTPAERTAIEDRALLLYDGVCALCNGSVSFLLKHDRHDQLRYAPLQSALGREMLARAGIYLIPDGVVLITNALTPAERVYRRSDAAAAALELLRPPWSPLGRLLRLVPRPLRELGYRIVARLRYRLFGRYDTCPIPPPAQRARLLGVYE